MLEYGGANGTTVFISDHDNGRVLAYYPANQSMEVCGCPELARTQTLCYQARAAWRSVWEFLRAARAHAGRSARVMSL